MDRTAAVTKMKFKQTLALVICLVPLIGWCADLITISGRVVAESGTPVKDARVVVYYWRSCVANGIAGQTNTDSKGVFHVSFTNQVCDLMIVARGKDDRVHSDLAGFVVSAPISTNGVDITIKGDDSNSIKR